MTQAILMTSTRKRSLLLNVCRWGAHQRHEQSEDNLRAGGVAQGSWTQEDLRGHMSVTL